MSSLLGLGGNIPSAAAAGFYTHQIANSCRFDVGSSSNLSLASASTSGNNDYWTFSFWWKSNPISTDQTFLGAGDGTGNSDNYLELRLRTTTDNTIRSASTDANVFTTTAMFRDPSAWSHGLWNNNNGTSTFYINGTQVATGSLDGGAGSAINSKDMTIGKYTLGTSQYYGGYLAEVMMVSADSSAAVLTPTSFTETKNGVFIPKDISGLSNQDFYLKFENSADLGNDSSGNNRDWTSNGLAAEDQMLDSPTFDSDTNGGNFATLNPLVAISGVTFSEGNLKEADDNSGWQAMWSTMAVPSGKYYFEAEFTEGSRDRGYIGVAQSIDLATYQDSYYAGQTNNSAGWYSANGSVYINASTTGSTLNTYTTGDIVGCAIDIDNGYVYFSKNGTWEDSGDPTSGATGTGGFSLSASTSGDSWHLIVSGWGSEFIVNYGQDPSFAGSITAGTAAPDNGLGLFKYDVPAGYKALCSGNLPTPAADPADDDGPGKYFNAVIYTGTGSSQGITGVGFQPDVVLIKNRGETDAWNHQNDVLGVGKTQAWNSDAAVASETDCIDSFDSDGFTVDTNHKVNASSETYVAYCWKESADAGFDIYTYSGTGSQVTVSHDLGVAPDLILNFLNVGAAWDSTAYWNTPFMGTAKGVFMPLYNAAQTTTYVDSTSTTNFVTTNMSTSGRTYFGYTIANKEGLVRVGQYTGNGDANGTFVYTGFKPAFILCKRADSASFGNWRVMDDARDPDNVGDKSLLPNSTSAAETGSDNYVDLLSNGFKLRNTQNWNSSGTYVFLAIAHNPFKYATAR